VGIHPVKCNLDKWPEVKCHPHLVAGAINQVGNLNHSLARVKPDRAPVAGSGTERGITVVLGGPTQR
jgi:hypothetical protein